MNRRPLILFVSFMLMLPLDLPAKTPAATDSGTAWTFAVSGDSRNCGDLVMPAIAARVRVEDDAFYWHLGDLRAIYKIDEDFAAMDQTSPKLLLPEYQEIAWDDFLLHQMAPFGDLPVFVGRGNHETIAPMTRDRFNAKFSAFLNRPEILLQNRADNTASPGSQAPPSSPWFHFVRSGVDFITLDNASSEEFSNAQLTWLHGILLRDQDPKSGITTIIAGMHEALPHSTSSGHSMDDWYQGTQTGEAVYRWFAAARQAGKHVYLLASHSHFYSPAIYNTAFWTKEGIVLPGIIIGSAGAQRYVIPATASPDSKTDIYAYLKGTVHPDGSVQFDLKTIEKSEMLAVKWPNMPASVVDFCYDKNSLTPGKN